MKWILTGASGFVGKALCKRLLNDSNDVRMIPRDMLSNFYQLHQYLEAEQPDYIIHLAAYGNYHHQTELRKIYSVNLDNLINLLEASKDVKYQQFINFSSSSVLGVQEYPMKSTSLPNPDTYYASSKLAGESLCEVFSKINEKSVVSLRPFSITGVGEQDNHLIPTLIRNGLGGDKIKLVTTPTHDYIDIEDVIDLILKICDSDKKHKGDIIHAGNAIITTNLEVLETVESVLSKKINYEEVENLRSYDSKMWVAEVSDIFKSFHNYNWKPKKTLEQSITEMYEAIT